MPTKKQPATLTLLQKSRTRVPASPEKAKLECFRNSHPDRDYTVTFDCPEFTSICPVTSQPDFGAIEIEYVPDRLCIESKSLKLYLFSYRNHGIFYEAAVNRILDDIVKACKPRFATVTGSFTARGGIAITVEATYP